MVRDGVFTSQEKGGEYKNSLSEIRGGGRRVLQKKRVLTI